MVIGQTEEKTCPLCQKHATWRNHDTNWKIYCSGDCGDYSITTAAINFISVDNIRNVDAQSLIGERILNTPLTPAILADYASSQHTREMFEKHYPGFTYPLN